MTTDADLERRAGAADRARVERLAQGLPPMVEDETLLRRAAAIFTAPLPLDRERAAS